eukprot:6578068-Alexandrium_andersonii.AAC.1
MPSPSPRDLGQPRARSPQTKGDRARALLGHPKTQGSRTRAVPSSPDSGPATAIALANVYTLAEAAV